MTVNHVPAALQISRMMAGSSILSVLGDLKHFRGADGKDGKFIHVQGTKANINSMYFQ